MRATERKTNNRRGIQRILLFVLLLICLGGAFYLGYLGFSELNERQQGNAFYEDLKPKLLDNTSAFPLPSSAVHWELVNETGNADDTAAAEANATATNAEPRTVRLFDFDSLKESCPDIVGWIEIDGHTINYPIVQGANDSYYIDHLADKTPNRSGAIFLSCRNNHDFTDPVNIVHGHHMRNGSMFAKLDNYKNESFYQEHRCFHLYTPVGDYAVEVVAAYTVDGYTYGYPIAFSSEAEFDLFIRKARSSTHYETDVEVNFDDKLLLLSTCDYDFQGARFIVIGKLVPIQY